EPLYRKALEIRSRVFGEDHLLTLQGYNNLALVLTHRSRLPEAELLVRRALHLQSNAGEENRSTAVWHTNLAHNLQAQGRHAEAKASLEQAQTIMRRVLHDEHRETALTSIDLAVNLNVQEKYDEAEPLFRTAVKTLRQRLGERHPLAIQASSNLGGNLYYQGKFAEAEAIHKDALAGYQELFGPRQPQHACAYKNLNIDLWVQGNYAEAEKIATATAESFEGARRQSGVAGLERTEFAAENSPLPLLAAMAARGGKPEAAGDFSNTTWRGDYSTNS